MALLELSFQSGESTLSVRRFSIHEAVSTPFTVSVWARSDSPAIDIGAIVGQPAGFRMRIGYAQILGGARVWSGLCSYMEQVHAERRDTGVLSTYYLRIVPLFWQLDHRRNHRIFQHLSIPDIVDKLLDEWGIKRVWRVDRGSYPKLEYKVQYAESDFAFLSRLLEEAGIAYTFPDTEEENSVVTFNDALQQAAVRAGSVLYEHNPTQAAGREFISRVQLVRDVRPGAFTIRDHDFRKPDFQLLGEAPRAGAPEDRYEQYHYMPGGFLVETGAGGDTPVADDKGVARHDQAAGTRRATRALEAARADRAGIAFESNLVDLHPGVIFGIDNHPHPDLGRKVLVTDTTLEGTADGEWQVFGHAVFADAPYRPPLTTPRPEVLGVQTATVVGPKGVDARDEEIHVDEFGRVRVQLPWDRHGASDDDSSCWMRVNEGWGGRGYGWLNLPRVGHEVMVTFLEGDPDRPVIAGRLYNATHPVPYKLPEHKTVSTWKSDSSPTSNGFNEIKFEDMKGEELFYLQAEKNKRRLVKNDEILTVGHDRDKYVIAEEIETVDGDRTQVTLEERHEMTGSEHRVLIKGNKAQLIRGDESEVNEGERRLLVAKDQDIVVRGAKRERDEWDLNARVLGDRRERVGQVHSMTVLEERHEKVKGTFAREAGKELHVVAGKEAVGEAPDVTVQGRGGFLRIDATGVVISGTKVDINVSGSPGHGHGSQPVDPAEALEAKSRTGASPDVKDFQGQGVVKALEEELLKKARHKGPDPVRSLDLVKLALTADVSTPHDGTVLWSGGNDLAGAAAEQLALQRTAAGKPSARLEMTEGGKLLGQTVTAAKDPWEAQNPAWMTISKRLAQQASGEVNVVVSYLPIGERAILREEMKVLAANKKVTAINFWAMQKDSDGNYVKDAAGNFVLERVAMKDVLKPPVKK